MSGGFGCSSVLCGLSASNHKSIRLDSLTFGDVALFLIIYRILHELHISGKRFKKGANVVPSFCNFMKMQQKVVYGWTTIKFNMSPWYNHGRIPLFFESSMRSVQTKTPKLATARFISYRRTLR